MNYIVSELFLDPADKYRVRVIIDENRTEFFKFDHYPTQEEINTIVDNYLNTNNSTPEIVV